MTVAAELFVLDDFGAGVGAAAVVGAGVAAGIAPDAGVKSGAAEEVGAVVMTVDARMMKRLYEVPTDLGSQFL